MAGTAISASIGRMQRQRRGEQSEPEGPPRALHMRRGRRQQQPGERGRRRAAPRDHPLAEQPGIDRGKDEERRAEQRREPDPPREGHEPREGQQQRDEIHEEEGVAVQRHDEGRAEHRVAQRIPMRLGMKIPRRQGEGGIVGLALVVPPHPAEPVPAGEEGVPRRLGEGKIEIRIPDREEDPAERQRRRQPIRPEGAGPLAEQRPMNRRIAHAALPAASGASRASARAPMSRRQNPPGKPIASTPA